MLSSGSHHRVLHVARVIVVSVRRLSQSTPTTAVPPSFVWRNKAPSLGATNMAIGLSVTFNRWCTQYVVFLIEQWPHVSRSIVDDFLKYTCKAITAGTSGARVLRTSLNITLSALVVPLSSQTEEGLQEQLDQLHASVVAASVVGDVLVEDRAAQAFC